MSPPILSVRGLSVTFSEKPLFQNIELHIERGSRYCLIGKNGSGKSTLLKVLAQEIEYDEGEVFTQPGTTIKVLSQSPIIEEGQTVLDYVKGDKTPQYEAEDFLGKLGISGDLKTDHLSGGEQRRAALAKTLLGSPDILLLDEPTNHLDLPTIEWLESYLVSFRGAILVISHDRKFLANITNKTLWLNQGKLKVHNQGYKDYERWSEEVLLDEERQLKKLDTKLKLETQWLHQGVTARRKRNQGRLRALQKLRQDKRDKERQRRKDLEVGKVRSITSSKLVIQAEHISKNFGDKQIIKPFSIQIEKGDRIGIIGPNGAGKTTLLRMLIGQLKPDNGRVKVGHKVELVYFDQMRDTLASHKALWANMSDSDYIDVQGKARHVVGYLKDFLFTEKQIRGATSILSGGEKNRLALAKALAQKGNALVLDEPTNDLDMDTLDLLLELLSDYDGTLLLVSHDRDFLDRLTTSILVLDGLGNVEEFIGGYSDIVKKPKKVALPTKAKVKKSPKNQIKKVSFKDQFRFKQLTQEIEALEGKIQEMESILLSHDYNDDYLKLSSQLQKHKDQLSSLDKEWNELADIIEG